MTTRTDTYNFEYFKRGSTYASVPDYRRFVTLDYNLTSYVGIMGVGIISGWDIEEISGLQVQINPGRGIIDGYAAESPYTVEKRSEMVIGDREVEVIETDVNQIPLPNLTTSERAIYVAVIQAYDPTYNPVGPIENSNVKVVVPTVLDLYNNADNYIYAQRPAGITPYPLLSDYPYPSMERPIPSDYPNYTAYMAALANYQSQIAIVHAYQWRTDPANHFTEVEFIISTTVLVSSSKVLLGKVVTRSGSIYKIDISGIDSLDNMKSVIESQARDVIVHHHHGGSKPSDPPKVKLETDIRNTALKSYNAQSGVAVYTVMESEATSVTDGHQHTYTIDSDGNGYTVGIYGGYVIHFHTISEGIVSTPPASSENIPSHIHTLPSNAFSWTEESPYVVYINGIQFADQTSTDIKVDSVNKLITFYSGIGGVYKTYSTAFSIPNLKITYSYSAGAYSVYYFMLSMIKDFYAKYGDQLTAEDGSVANDPFVFQSTDGTGLVGLEDLESQSQVAQQLLIKIGDKFTFTPNAANNITIIVSNIVAAGYLSDDVTIEILGNSEVTGILGNEHILYINAQKITLGKFDIERIPFINHLGRMGEEFKPFQSSLISSDGIKWSITPSYTDIAEKHYHSTFLDQTNNGVTEDTLVGNDVVYYENGKTGTTYLVAHAHGVNDANVSSEVSTGLNDWVNDITESTNSNSVSHTHTLMVQDAGDPKTVYSILEDSSGNLFAGTASGFYMIPYGDSYLYVVNGEQIYLMGSDLWDLLLDAKEIYESRTGLPMEVTAAIYDSQIIAAESALISAGDSFIMYGSTNGSFGKDTVMIKKLDYFEVPNFKYISEKMPYEIRSGEIVTGVKYISAIDGSEIAPETVDEIKAAEANPDAVVSNAASNVSSSDITTLYLVEKSFSDVPIWSIESKKCMAVTSESQCYNNAASLVEVDNIYVVGSEVVAGHRNLATNLYGDWTAPTIPFYSGSLRKSTLDAEGNLWIATGNGLLISRSNVIGKVTTGVILPSSSLDVSDVVEAGYKDVFCAAGTEIFETNDSGKTWATRLTDPEGFSQILRDVNQDKTNTVSGHYHTLNVNQDGDGTLSMSIGSGASHTHNVDQWDIATVLSHTHTIVSTLYAITDSASIYKSEDSGISWTSLGSFSYNDRSSLYAFGGVLFGSSPDGLYKSTDGGNKWIKILEQPAYSYRTSYDRSKFMIGCHNAIYDVIGTTISLVIEFTGMPLPNLYREGSKQLFGYAYSNKSNSFHFYNVQYIDPNTSNSGIVDFNRWISANGSWDSETDYDIYINDQLIISTQKEIDKRTSSYPTFLVVPLEGVIDFAATSDITEEINIYDIGINVSSTVGFSIGDRILVKSDIDVGEVPVQGDSAVAFQQEIENYGQRMEEVSNMYYYGDITALSSNVIYVSERFDKIIELPARVHRIAPMEGSSTIYTNIYQSGLKNIGVNSHDELENELAYVTDGRPSKLDNAFLSNLLQLTQAVKYIYPSIDSEFHNTVFYDMHYSSNPLDPNYIGNYIDIPQSEASNQGIYGIDYVVAKAKGINQLLIGHGTFDGFIIAATDLGVFWAKIEDGMEANWFYVNGVNESVYDIKIFNGNTLYAATSSGIYVTEDMKRWSLLSSPSITYPVYSLALRWSGEETVTVPSHTATFSNDSTATYGVITSSSDIYNVLESNRNIKVENAGVFNGNYSIKEVISNQITLTAAFTQTVPSVKNGVVITMAPWWENFDGETNLGNPNIKNTLIAGGKNRISYNVNPEKQVWTQSNIPSDITNFIANTFLPIDSGLMLSGLAGTNSSHVINRIMSTNNLGGDWANYMTLDEITGTVNSSSISEFGNTVLQVSYDNEALVRSNGTLDLRVIYITNKSVSSVIYTGYVIWNQTNMGTKQLVVFGSTARDVIISSGGAIGFRIIPFKINSMVQASNQDVIFGTDNGIFSDKGSISGKEIAAGSITSIGRTATITQVDFPGKIMSVTMANLSTNVLLNVVMTDKISKDSLVGNDLYVTDLSYPQKVKILKNSVASEDGEISIEVNATYNSTWATYSTKKITVVGAKSRLFVTYNDSIDGGEFNGGNLYVVSNEKSNQGKTYVIDNNTSEYIDLSVAIIPQSTLYHSASSSTDVVSGQTVSMIGTSGLFELGILFDNDVSTNSLISCFLYMVGSTSSLSGEPLSINSNTESKIVLNPFVFDVPPLAFNLNDRISIRGSLLEKVTGFDSKFTSIEEGHYHDLNLVGKLLFGNISGLTNINNAFVTIDVSDTNGFSAALIQQNGELLKGATIRLYNSSDRSKSFETTVISHTATTIKVFIQTLSMWDFSAYNKDLISIGWSWQLDASKYGYTDETIYKDFASITLALTANALANDTQLSVEDTSALAVGNKISIENDIPASEINYITNIDSATLITLSTPLERSYYQKNNSRLKVLVDSFSNNHTHMVRGNEVETLNVSDYVSRGYFPTHSHRCLPILSSVSQLFKRNSEIIAIGSSEKVYSSYNDGRSWQETTDLNNALEGGESVSSISAITSKDNKLVVGASNGFIYSEFTSGSIVKLEIPRI